MKWNNAESSASNAARELPPLARDYFKAGRKAVKGRKSPRELHRFRVKTKRFRYALEMFRPVYGHELEELLEKLQELQRRLGKISDAYTIRELLKHDGAHKKDLDEHGRKLMAEFKEHWKTVFDAPPEREKWLDALARVAQESVDEAKEVDEDE
jgi:CHAD domain-containing protein